MHLLPFGAMDVEVAVTERVSTRAFLPREVPRPVLVRIFERAQRAPSWCNIQPWRVWVASGEARARLVRRLGEAARSGLPAPEIPFPDHYPEPYATRRRACGIALYQAMGIARDDLEARQAAWMRNFAAFDAPHVAIVGWDRRFGAYAALDVGCWLQSVLLLAHAEGVSTCPQASLATYPHVAREVLGIPEDVAIAFGIALGYADPEARANTCRTTREALEASVRFVDG